MLRYKKETFNSAATRADILTARLLFIISAHEVERREGEERGREGWKKE